MTDPEQKILQKHLARFMVEDVFNAVTEDDILQITATNVWRHKGKTLTEGQVTALRSEAKVFVNSSLWKILSTEVMYLAHQSGYVKSATVDDQIAAKMLQYSIETIQKRLDKMLK